MKQRFAWFRWPRLIPILTLLALGTVGIVQFHAHSQAAPPVRLDVGDLALRRSKPVLLTSQQAAIQAQKSAMAAEYARVRAGNESLATFNHHWQGFVRMAGGNHAAPAKPAYCAPVKTLPCWSARQVNVPQESQINRYYCGPAAVEEMLLAMGVTRGPLGEDLQAAPFPDTGQHILAGAAYLQTDLQVGTNWGNGTVNNTLNAWTQSQYYVPVNGTNFGGYFSILTYEQNLMLDVDIGYPLIGGIRMDPYPSSPHLVGFPTNETHYHWVTLMGYTNFGANTTYADSVHGDTQFWSWAANVPAYSTVSTSDVMFPLLNTFGYIW